MSLISPEVYAYFSFDPYLIFRGQIWRLFTWILTVPEELGIFTVIMMLLYYSLGTTLERTWGTYRYNVYMLSGFLFTVVGAIILYLVLTVYYSTAEGNMIYSSIIAQTMGQAISVFVSTYYINMSIFLAFAVTYPDMELLLYFIIPIKIKWFGFLYGGYIIYDIIYAFMNYPTILAVVQTTMIVLSLLNFLLYWFSGSRKRLGNMRRKREYVRSVQMAQCTGVQSAEERIGSIRSSHSVTARNVPAERNTVRSIYLRMFINKKFVYTQNISALGGHYETTTI